jgi:hypothetical protein
MDVRLFPADSEASKRWPNCREVKALGEFPNNRASKDGKATYCKPCHNQRMREIAERLYGGNANFLRIRRDGIDTATFDKMITSQAGLCALCGSAPAVHLDHVHSTGAIRGVLCFSCNRGLGKFGDDPAVIRRAAEYLTRSTH